MLSKSWYLVLGGLLGLATLLTLHVPLMLSLKTVLAFFYLGIYPFIRLQLDPEPGQSPRRWTLLLISCVLASSAHFVSPGWLAGLLFVPFIGQALRHLQRRVLPRLQRRSLFVASETWLDLSLLMIVGHMIWSFASLLPLAFLGFHEPDKTLTAIHFAYAGFAIPFCFAQLFQSLEAPARQRARIYSLSLILYFAGFFLVALGIYQLPFLEVLGGSLMALALGSLGVQAWTCRPLSFLQKVGLASLSMLLSATMFAMLNYAGRSYFPQPFSLADMIRWHGIINAYVIVPGLLAWTFSFPRASKFPYARPPLGRILGKRGINAEFLKTFVVDDGLHRPTGLTDRFASFASAEFAAHEVDADVQRFYEHIEDFDMQAGMRWHFPFHLSSWLYRRISSNLQQFNFPEGDSAHVQVQSRICRVDSQKDGREHVRAWIRTYRTTGETLYVALYSQHTDPHRVYMNIAFPWFHSQLTSILRLENHRGTGVRLTTRHHQRKPGFEGIFVLSSRAWLRIPMNETIDVWRDGPDLRGLHRVWFLGLPLLTLDYLMTPRME